MSQRERQEGEQTKERKKERKKIEIREIRRKPEGDFIFSILNFGNLFQFLFYSLSLSLSSQLYTYTYIPTYIALAQPKNEK